MAEEKPAYTLTIELDSSRPDALAKAIDQLRDIASEFDTTGKAKATIKFESYRQLELNEIMDTFEEWLYKFAIGLGCFMHIKRPGLRPESISKFREIYATPMDDAGMLQPQAEPEEQEAPDEEQGPIDGEAVITPDSYQRMALPKPRLMLTVAEGDFVIEDEREEA